MAFGRRGNIQGHTGGVIERGAPGDFPPPTGVSLPEYALHQSIVSRHRIDLSTERSDKRFTVGAADWLWAYRASSAAALISVKFNSPETAPFPVTQGFFISGLQFTDLVLANDVQAGAWIELYTGRAPGGVYGLNPGSTITTVSLAPWDTVGGAAFVTTGPGTFDTLVAADSNRRRAVIYNQGPNLLLIGYGPDPPSIVFHLTPGETFELFATAEIVVSSSLGTTQVHCITEGE